MKRQDINKKKKRGGRKVREGKILKKGRKEKVEVQIEDS